MPTMPIILLAAVLAVAASGTAHAEDLAILPSHVCQPPSHDEFAVGTPRDGDANAAARLADERWTRAFQAAMARCQPGDVLVLPARDGEANIARYCEFDRAIVRQPPPGSTACIFAGGVRDLR